MTAHARWNFAPALAALMGLTAAATATLAQAASEDRVFGQLRPGQTVVEIDQSSTAIDDGWTPVAQAVPPGLLPSGTSSETDSGSAIEGEAGSTTMGGLNILEELAQRQAEADAASATHAARMAAQRDQAHAAEVAAAESPSELVLPDLPPQEYRPIGGAATAGVTSTGLIESGATAAAAPSTNFARDWFEGQSSAVQTMLALGVVILLIYALAWTYRKMNANQGGVAGVNSGKAPSGLLEVLGRYPLGNKQSLVLLKFDRRVLLLSQGPSGKGGVEMKTLCELDEPEDVASVLMKVRDADGNSLNKAFRSAMNKAEIGASASERMIEPKAVASPGPAKPAKPSRPSRVEPKAEVLPGHRDPFNGFGGDFVNPTRNVNSTPEGDRSELWGTPTAAPAGDHDPVASLKQRLEAMRRGDRVS